MSCDACKLYFCFNCGQEIGDHENGYEKAKVHYEKAYCRYIDPGSKIEKVEQVKNQILGELGVQDVFDDFIANDLEYQYNLNY